MNDEASWKRRRAVKRVLRKLRVPFEWALIAVGELVLSNVSHRTLFRICDFLSAAMYRFDARGRKLALINLRVVERRLKWDPETGAAVPPQPSVREELILRRSYRNMARTIGHIFWTAKDAAARAASVAELAPECRAWLQAHRPGITVSAHLGCWEVLSQLVHLEGIPMTSVAKDIGTAAMTRLLMKSRKSIGQEILHAQGAFRPLLQALKDGRDIGLLVDQFVHRSDGGVWVKFHGFAMCVTVAPAFLAAKAQVPIIVAWSRPLKDGRYRCESIATFDSAKGTDVRERTVEIMQALERTIRRHPSCWILNYRYWNDRPQPGEKVYPLKAT